MAEAEGKSLQNEHISMQMSAFPRDLLQRFISENGFPREVAKKTEEIELSLGLSLNGRFGVDPKAQKLVRSSSIPDFINPARDDERGFPLPMMCTPLGRTCSLPVETEEEWRKRKEMQSLRRMEAKRKRMEKQRNLRAATAKDPDRACLEGNFVLDKQFEDKVVIPINGNEFKPLGLSGKRGMLVGGGLERLPPPPPGSLPSSQGSIGSQGSVSSSISDFETQQVRVMNKWTEPNEQKRPVTLEAAIDKSGKTTGVVAEKASKKRKVVDMDEKEIMRNVMTMDMPCVSTKGDGPNGKRLEGFLYRYRDEEVRIVCVCHGTFFSPAEFVKHAGGGDVENPLKHIVVNSAPLQW